MATEEYLAFLPLLIYGIAIADLLSEWKRIFTPSKRYLPYILLTIVLSELAMYNVYVYMKVVVQLANLNYYQYLLSITPPFLFMLMTNVFTPDKDENTKAYFLKNKPIVFTLLSLFLASHFMYNFDEHIMTILGRALGIVFILIAGFIPKNWSSYVPVILWLLFVFFRAQVSLL